MPSKNDYFSAIDPKVSAYVSSSAGTGKTKILIDRILNLMLAKVPNRRILCVTFTNTAAIEMHNRIIKKLQIWNRCSENELIDELSTIMPKNLIPKHIQYARKVLYNYCNDPIKIQTIHGFCQGILKYFPLESGLPINFGILQISSIITKSIYLDLLHDMNCDQRLKKIMDDLCQYNIIDLINSFLLNKANIDIKKSIKLKNTNKALDQYIASIESNLDKLKELDKLFLEINIDLINNSKIFNIDLAHSNSMQIIQNIEQLTDIFLTKSLTPRVKVLGIYSNKNEFIRNIQNCLLEYLETINYNNFIKTTKDLGDLFLYVSQKYEQFKQTNNKLDYNDLIHYTARLLTDNPLKDWILYKMDGLVDHILIDEAQDTSSIQWQVIHSIIMASSIQNEDKTIFIVGDDKQSIYSFQGTNISDFINYKIYIEKALKANKKQFISIALNKNYRCGQNIITTSNRFFEYIKKNNPEYLAEESNFHMDFGVDYQGFVELWINNYSNTALIDNQNVQTADNQRATSTQNVQDADKQKTTSANSRINSNSEERNDILDRIVAYIKESIDKKLIIQSSNRPVQLNDFLILTRTRDKHFSLLNQKLIEANLKPTECFDLMGTKVFKILISLAKFVTFPHDDMNLLILLKNLYSLDDTEIYRIAANRENISLMIHITENHKTYAKDLENFLVLKHLGLIEFFETVISIFCQNGIFDNKDETQEYIQAFNEIVHNSVNDNKKTIEEFLNVIENGNFKYISFDTNGVCLNTIHSVKGLESPIVIFLDNGFLPRGESSVLIHDNMIFLKNSMNCKLGEAIKTKHQNEALQEYMRLFYVALTRAKDGFILCTTNDTPSPNSYYSLFYNFFKNIDSIKTTQSSIRFGNIVFDDRCKSLSTEKYIYNLVTKEDGPTFNGTIFNEDILLQTIESNNSHQRRNMELGISIHKIFENLMNDFDNVRNGIIRHRLLNSLSKDLKDKVETSIYKLFNSQLFSYINEINFYTEIETVVLLDNEGGPTHSLKRIDLLGLEFKDNLCTEATIIDYKLHYKPTCAISSKTIEEVSFSDNISIDNPYIETIVLINSNDSSFYQLQNYADNIKKIINPKEIKTYIISILDCRVYLFKELNQFIEQKDNEKSFIN